MSYLFRPYTFVLFVFSISNNSFAFPPRGLTLPPELQEAYQKTQNEQKPLQEGGPSRTQVTYTPRKEMYRPNTVNLVWGHGNNVMDAVEMHDDKMRSEKTCVLGGMGCHMWGEYAQRNIPDFHGTKHFNGDWMWSPNRYHNGGHNPPLSFFDKNVDFDIRNTQSNAMGWTRMIEKNWLLMLKKAQELAREPSCKEKARNKDKPSVELKFACINQHQNGLLARYAGALEGSSNLVEERKAKEKFDLRVVSKDADGRDVYNVPLVCDQVFVFECQEEYMLEIPQRGYKEPKDGKNPHSLD